MSDLSVKIKKLIKKAKETGDMELLDLATDLIDSQSIKNSQEKINKEVTKNEAELDNKFPEFSMKSESKMRQPVEVKKRTNLYVDKGEHKDEHNITPNVELTERRRPTFKKVDQTCQRCSKVVSVNPSFVRDFFTCDSCLRR